MSSTTDSNQQHKGNKADEVIDVTVSDQINSTIVAQRVRKQQIIAELAPYMSLGIQMTMTILLLGGIGWWIDSSRNGSKAYTVTGLALGSVIGLVNLLRAVVSLQKRSFNRDEKQHKADTASNS
jgi:F0F1-type ATP synthase assembly protein I